MEEDNIEDELKKQKKSLKIKYILFTIIISIIVAIASSEYTLYYYFGKTPNKTESSNDAKENIDAIAENLKDFREVIDDNFIGEIDEQKVLDFIAGMTDDYFTKMYNKCI